MPVARPIVSGSGFMPDAAWAARLSALTCQTGFDGSWGSIGASR